MLPVVLSGGLFPRRSSGHPRFHQKPSRSSWQLAAASSAMRHPSGNCCSPSMVLTTISATSGFRWPIMGKESAHDAQFAAAAQRVADLIPNPPIHMGKVVSARANWRSSCPPGHLLEQGFHCFPDATVVLLYVVAGKAGRESTQGVFGPRIGALQQQLRGAQKVFHMESGVPQLPFLCHTLTQLF